ncbi:hypothetical protein [Paenibacillus popilliae]|uniref:Ribosomal protein S1 n=1 Tax=Paenibacillus popilliae ATCC 14706 TaxID=1212764 RepID=M9LMK9_PAEPP|nr:hypothetical protein [Paenibacillus popilliae]GAC41411.1 ribosomal protein S1 [Paenibacillus popilliae ATCC 14706]
MYVIYEETPQGKVVTTVYMNPEPERMQAQGVEIDGELPKPDDIPGMRPVLKLKLEEKELYYDYERPNTVESRVQVLQEENEELRKQIESMQLAVMGMMGGGNV